MTVADINAVVQAFRDGVANQDAEALSRIYHEDARFLPPNMAPFEGRPAIRQAFQQLLDMGVRSVDLEPIDVREAADLTIEYGRYTLGLETGDGQTVSDVGKYLVVHETRDGTTRISYDIFNSNSPPPG
ncbi:MAG TPA: SgcJ/EcaC family oxidoreductase [Gaiellaceae bacterium]|nr:SgcJ/EcaC family oxidoreductase [Gaiellaceae bacterium]